MVVDRARLSVVSTLATLVVVLTLQTMGFPQPADLERGQLRPRGLKPGNDTGVVSVI
jgi:hypothetical protein